MNAGKSLRDVWFYRDQKKREIDLLIQEGHILHPVEVKMSATVGKDAVKNFSCLEGLTAMKLGLDTLSVKPRIHTLLPRMSKRFPCGAYDIRCNERGPERDVAALRAPLLCATMTVWPPLF